MCTSLPGNSSPEIQELKGRALRFIILELTHGFKPEISFLSTLRPVISYAILTYLVAESNYEAEILGAFILQTTIK